MNHLYTFLLLIVLLVHGCAVPVAPTGGPTDSRPPEIESISPERNAVNVSTNQIRIVFNEYVNQGSFQQAFEINPELSLPPEFKWKKKRVDVVLRDTLRANTTYIITIDNNLKDINGVSPKSPSVVAFSTGSEINKAGLTGQVISAIDGSEQSGFEVHAFMMPDSSTFPAAHRKPDYRTQTDSDGIFTFSYLAPGLYYLLSFDDVNRNKVPDGSESRGGSRVGGAIASPDSSSNSLLITAVQDTIPPLLRRASSLSQSRTNLTFSEGIVVDTSSITLRDSNDSLARIDWIYTVTPDAREIAIISEVLRGDITVHSTASDSSGNRDSSSVVFSANTQPDSASIRFDSFFSHLRPDSLSGTIPYLAEGTFGFRTNGVQPLERFRQGVTASSAGRPLEFRLLSNNGRTIRVERPGGSVFPDSVTVRLQGESFSQPDTVYQATFVRVPQRRLGELSGFFRAPADDSPVVFELEARDIVLPDNLRTTVGNNTSGQFVFPRLPEGRYRIRAFVDSNQNGKWDPGSLFPFAPYELIAWTADTLRVRPRWESVIADTVIFDTQHVPRP